MKKNIKVGVFFFFCVVLGSCESNEGSQTSLDTSGSATQMAVAAVGGAVSSTASDTLALSGLNQTSYFAKVWKSFEILPEAWASFGRCPTSVKPYNGSCSVSGNTMILLFPIEGCVFNAAGPGPIWIGGTTLTTSEGDLAPSCGTYPGINGSTITSVTRKYLGSLRSNPTARTNQSGTQTVVLDTSASSSTGFQPATQGASATSGTMGWQYSINTGGGYERSFVSGVDHNLTLTIRTVGFQGSGPSGTVQYDHTLSTTNSASVSTPLNISVLGTGTSRTDTVNGVIYLQHNLMKMTAKVEFTNAVHPWGCCYPNSGTVTTTFDGGPNDGKQESMRFSDATCTLGTLGQVQFTDVNGNVTSKTLTHCF